MYMVSELSTKSKYVPGCLTDFNGIQFLILCSKHAPNAPKYFFKNYFQPNLPSASLISKLKTNQTRGSELLFIQTVFKNALKYPCLPVSSQALSNLTFLDNVVSLSASVLSGPFAAGSTIKSNYQLTRSGVS